MAWISSLQLQYALCLSAMLATTFAIPATIFPFNSQVPTVARVGQAYNFQLSASTFAPADDGVVYAISGQPVWLSLDAASLTLAGVPGQADIGSNTFAITAANDAGQARMQCTLVVSSNPFPQLVGDLGQQLAAEANLSSSDPPTVSLLPGEQFIYHFRQDSFIDIVQRTLFYYATLADHTPLPAWVSFDPSTLSFSGIAPQLSAFPQSFTISLIASDVEGFAGTSVSYELVVAQSQLAFVPEEREVQFKPGAKVEITNLPDTLYQNGETVDMSTLKNAKVSSMPSWLSFDEGTMSLTGEAPDGAVSTNMSLTVSAATGESAVLALHLIAEDSQTTLFGGMIGILNATAGEPFQYTVPQSIVSAPDTSLNVILPASAKWLHFDDTTRKLMGDVPTATTSVVTATLSARSPRVPQAQTQVFYIDLQIRTTITTTFVTSRSSPTQSATSTPLPEPAIQDKAHELNSSVIAGIVIGVLLLLAFLILLLWTFYRKRKQEGYERQFIPSKKSISRPLGPPEVDEILVTKELHRDIEQVHHTDEERTDESLDEAEKPPHLALDLPMHSARNSRWTNRFSCISQASSLGTGEETIRADSNIPEWGGEPPALQMSHDSFSVPAQLARVSQRLSQMSRGRQALRRLRARREKHRSEDSLDLGIEMGGAAVMPRHSSRHEKSRRRYDSSAGLSATIERSSCASLSTRGTSLLSTRSSEFPRPPARSAFSGSRSIPSMSAFEAEHRQSIRIVGRSDSIAEDGRTMQDKRESYLKLRRASTGLQNPLFGSSQVTRSTGGSSSTDMNGGTVPGSRRSKRIKSQLTSYSQSSSVEPTRGSKRFSQRLRSTFAPNYPRAVTRSTLYADEEGVQEGAQGNDSDYYTISASSSDSEDFAAQLAKPRNQRSFVIPGEASPTPPPVAPPTSRQPSRYRGSTPASDSYSARYRRRIRAGHSASPLAVSVMERKASQTQALRSTLSEPLDLASNDSLSKAKARPEWPTLVQTNSGRPVSVDDVQRFSSLKARTKEEADALAGSGVWEEQAKAREAEGTGLLMKSECGSINVGTSRSGMSGVKAFI